PGPFFSKPRPAAQAMARSLTVGAIGAAYAASLWPSWRRFVAAARAPEAAQGRYLRRWLRNAAATIYGSAHRAGSIDSPRQFQDRVPIVDYDGLAPYMQRA